MALAPMSVGRGRERAEVLSISRESSGIMPTQLLESASTVLPLPSSHHCQGCHLLSVKETRMTRSLMVVCIDAGFKCQWLHLEWMEYDEGRELPL
jgi:hypothetical protein